MEFQLPIGEMGSLLEDLDLRLESIGTQMEKTLHKTIKHYLCPDAMCHEFKVGPYIADIYKDGKIIEIQTGSFKSLQHKLNTLLKNYPITLVHPIVRRKTLYTLDASGFASKPKKSPKMGHPNAIFRELAQIKEFLMNPNLSIWIFMVDVDEYRRVPIEKQGRKPYERIEQFAKGIPDIIKLTCIADYRRFLPELPSEFVITDVAKVTKLNKSDANAMVSVFKTLGFVSQIGKRGRAYLYQINS